MVRSKSVRLLLHIDFRSAPEIQLHLRSVRRFHANLHSARAINSRIFRSPDIRLGGLKIVRGSCAEQRLGEETTFNMCSWRSHCFVLPRNLRIQPCYRMLLLDRDHGHGLGFEFQSQLSALSLRRNRLRHDGVRRVESIDAVNLGRGQSFSGCRFGVDAS